MPPSGTQNFDKKAMERKMALLEQRLILVEEFVGTRFCESFRDFTVRKKMPPQDSGLHFEESNVDPSPKPGPALHSRDTRSSRRVVKSSSTTADDQKTSSSRKELFVRIVRIDKVGDGGNSSNPPHDDDGNSGDVPGQACELPVNIKGRPDSEGDDNNASDGYDDYFVFPPTIQNEEQNNDVDDPLDTSGVEPDHPSWDDSDYEDSTTASRKKRAKTSSGPGSTKKKRKKPTPHKDKRECPVCHAFWKHSVFDRHLQTHGKERHLKCSFCEKRFFTRKHLMEHEKSHQRQKYGKKCRVHECKQICINVSKLLVHERMCIRKALETENYVDPKVIEDVKKRSQNVSLNWPEYSNSSTADVRTEEVGDDTEKSLGGATKGKGTKQCPHCEVRVLREVYSQHLRTHASNKKSQAKKRDGAHGNEGEEILLQADTGQRMDAAENVEMVEVYDDEMLDEGNIN